MKKRLKHIMIYAKQHRLKFIILFACIIVTTFSGALFPYIFGRLVDEVFYAKDMSKFLNIIIIYGIIFLFNQIIHFTLNISWAKLMTKFLFDIRKDIFSKVLSYKGNTLSGQHLGDTISRMGGDTEQFMDFIHWNVFYTIGGILNLILSIGFIFYFSWPLAILTIIMTPISVYISRYFAKKVKVFYHQMSENGGFLSSWLFEIIKGMQDIKLLNAGKNVLSDYIGKSIKISRLQIKANKVEIVSECINSGIALIGQMVLYIISAILIFKGDMTLGGFTACVSYFGVCTKVFNSLNDKSSAIAGNMVGIDRVISVLEEESEVYNDNLPVFTFDKGIIVFKNVYFSYNDDINVLNDISFDIRDGERISLVGHSGAGKSTIANLIYKLFEIQDGKILIDNIDIYNCNLYSLREQIGIVHQDTILFNDTLRYNLVFSNDSGKDEHIWQVLKRGHLYKFVKSLPEGLDTQIGFGGQSLSGGQKQRLAVARIFLKNPKILIFDEATSSLDSEAEQVIQNSWEDICKDRTIIIIAHRLSTIINSDKVLVLQDGQIAGYDKHENLLRTCDTYVNLFKEQYSTNEEVNANVYIKK